MSGTPAQIITTNVLGTWHVLGAAEAHQMTRVITFSSAQVFGFAEGERVPDYLPVDDNHAGQATLDSASAPMRNGFWVSREPGPI